MFEEIGYFKEYYKDGKYIGSIKSEKDRAGVGYEFRMVETTNEKIVLSNKKTIKMGETVLTILYPLSGKIIR